MTGEPNKQKIYLPKFNNTNTETTCKICPKSTIKTPDTDLFIVNFEQISYLLKFPS